MQPILLEETAENSQLTCDHELSKESEVAGKLGIAFDEYKPKGCVPDAFVWEENVSPVTEDRCGTCHGSEELSLAHQLGRKRFCLDPLVQNAKPLDPLIDVNHIQVCPAN